MLGSTYQGQQGDTETFGLSSLCANIYTFGIRSGHIGIPGGGSIIRRLPVEVDVVRSNPARDIFIGEMERDLAKSRCEPTSRGSEW